MFTVRFVESSSGYVNAVVTHGCLGNAEIVDIASKGRIVWQVWKMIENIDGNITSKQLHMPSRSFGNRMEKKMQEPDELEAVEARVDVCHVRGYVNFSAA